MSKKLNELSTADRAKIREDMIEHGNIERCAIENGVSEKVVEMVAGVKK